MGKGDGKNKRKKKKPSSTTSTQATTPQPAPQRVTTDINIPVRKQIKFAQMKKEAMKSNGNSFRANNVKKRTKYRKTLDEEEAEAAKIQRRELRKEPDWDVILNGTMSSPLVIVDAYNIIHKWPRLKKWMNKGLLSRARDLLVKDLEELRRIKGWRIEVVFDGAGRKVGGALGDNPGGKSATEKVSRADMESKAKVTEHGVRVVFSGVGFSADSYIEKRCYDAKQVTEGKYTGSLIVASSDNMIRVAAQNAGALCMSADRMLDELRAVRSAALYRVEVAVARVNGCDVRPTKLQGKNQMTNVFRRGQILIEDKRNRPKRKKKTEEEKLPMNAKEIMEGTKTVPSWAVVPNSTANDPWKV